MNTKLNYDQIAELDRLHRAACMAHHAYKNAKKAMPNVLHFTLRRDYQVASKALADAVRATK